MKLLVSPSFALAAIAFIALPVRAVPVGNYDFTSPYVGSAGYYAASGAGGNTAVNDWTFYDPESVGGLTNSSAAPSGQVAFFNNTDDASNSNPTNFPLNTITYNGFNTQALPTVAADTDYTLTVALGVPGGSFPVADYTLSLLVDGTSYALGTVDSANFGLDNSTTQTPGYTPGTFYDFSVTLSAATIAADNLAGGQLGIVLGSQEDATAQPYGPPSYDYAQTYFSDVRLSATPEPSTWAMMGLMSGGLMLVLRARKRSESTI